MNNEGLMLINELRGRIIEGEKLFECLDKEEKNRLFDLLNGDIQDNQKEVKQ